MDNFDHLLPAEAAIAHSTKGIGIWDWASNDRGAEPDVVMASCGDVPTMESLAATALLRQHLPDVKVRFVNVVDLAKLVSNTEHPHGLTDREFEAIFTPDKPVVFNFHAYPWLIHRLTYRRPGQRNIHVRGYKEQGNINTPLELAIRPTALASPSMRLTGSRGSELQAPTLARPSSTSRSRVKSTPTSSASIGPRSRLGSGHFRSSPAEARRKKRMKTPDQEKSVFPISAESDARLKVPEQYDCGAA